MHFSRFIRISFRSFALSTLRRAAFRVCLVRRRGRVRGKKGTKGRTQEGRQSLYLLLALGLFYF